MKENIKKAYYEHITAALKCSSMIFSVTFVKKNGELRKMVARTKVARLVAPEDRKRKPYRPNPPHLVTVFDMQKVQYRNVNMNTIKEIKAFGKTFNFEESIEKGLAV